MSMEVLSVVSHELRTPLTAIAGYVKLILEGSAGTLTEKQRNFLNIVDLNIARLTEIIDNTLDVEKIESGKFQLILEPQQISALLEECHDTFLLLAEKKGLSFECDFPKELKPVLGHKARLIQVFMNLISNAIKYTEKGFVKIQAEQDDQNVLIHILDSGVGLSREEQTQIFQKYFRAQSNFNSMQEGLGLGLVIAQKLVQAHGGEISVSSSVGGGTCFSVRLPIYSPAPAGAYASQNLHSINVPVDKVILSDPLLSDIFSNKANIEHGS